MSRATYPLKLPNSVKKAAQRLAKEDGVSLNQWIAAAVAEKVGVIETAADFFKKRAGKAKGDGLMKFLRNAPRVAPESEVEEVAIRVRVENLKNGRYLGTSPDVPGLVAEGRSVAETVEIAQGLARKIVESCREHGDRLPAVFRSKARSKREFRVPVSVS